MCVELKNVLLKTKSFEEEYGFIEVLEWIEIPVSEIIIISYIGILNWPWMYYFSFEPLIVIITYLQMALVAVLQVQKISIRDYLILLRTSYLFLNIDYKNI